MTVPGLATTWTIDPDGRAAPGGRVSAALRKELRVAFSTRAQPVWFRVLKWLVFLALTRRLRGKKWLRAWIGGGVLAGLGVHLVYRRKTQAWTRPWGGWDDLAAAAADHAPGRLDT